ncbi:MAG: ABC transporter ATP-binding protein [Thermomicrobiales bacterium]
MSDSLAGAETAVPDAIATEGLTKAYDASHGVFDLHLTVRQGEIFGFLGPNGAGKTTTIRMLLDLIRPTTGRATVLGWDARRDAVAIHRATGYLPGEFSLDPRLTGYQSLVYLANLRGGVAHSTIAELAERLGLDLHRPFNQYSRGNKQKVGLIQAFMHRPRLLILDEPTAGLDPLNQETVFALIREARAEGRTVFFSSHILSEVQTLCERVGFIREGRLIRVATVHELLGLRVLRVEAECAEPLPPDVLADIPEATGVVVADRTVRCTVRGDMDAVVKRLARYHVLRLVSEEPNLNEIFLHLYEGDGVAAVAVSEGVTGEGR